MPAVDFGDAFEAQPAPARSIQLGLRGPVGSGKTADMIEAIETVLASSADATCAVFVPNHKLADEFAGRLRAKGVEAEVWRGMDQPDPEASAGAPRRMCERGDVVRQVREAGGAIEDVCGSKRRGFCAHHPDAGGGCGYVAQRRRRARVWIMPHAMLHRPASANMRRENAPPADLVIIDECFTSAMLGGFDARPVKFNPAGLSASCFAAVPDRGGIPGMNTMALRRALDALAGVVSATPEGECVTSEAFDAAGLNEHGLRSARRLALSCKKPLPRAGLPGADASALPTALGTAAQDNRAVLDVARLLRIAADVASGRLGAEGLRIGLGNAAGSVLLRWREDIHPDWLAAPKIIHADATMNETIVRQWLPDLHAPAVPPVAAPHMRAAQIEDRAFGYSSVVPSKGGSAGAAIPVAPQSAAASAVRGNMARVARTIAELASRYTGTGSLGGPDVLAVLPNGLEEALAAGAGTIPTNVGTAHFNNLRGLDAFKNVGALLIVSRPLPPPGVVEDRAGIIFGPGVRRLARGAFYPKRPAHLTMVGGTLHPMGGGGRYYHPDPQVEAVRWAHCEAELIQAIGRGRGTLRTASNPLDVLILTNVPLEGIEVTEACTLDDVWLELGGDDLVRPMLEAGILPADWAGIGAVLTACGRFRGAVDPGGAARKCFARDQSMEAALAAARRAASGTNNGRNSYIYTIREVSVIRATGGWTAFTYRRKGQRKSARVLIAPWHADPSAAAERALGPLEAFTLSSRPSRRSRVARSQTATVPDLPPPIEAATGAAPIHSQAGSGPSVATAPVPEAPDLELERRIASVPLRLPAVLNVLHADGKITKADKRSILGWFHLAKGTDNERERNTLAKLARRIGPGPIQAAARQSALAMLASHARPPDLATNGSPKPYSSKGAHHAQHPAAPPSPGRATVQPRAVPALAPRADRPTKGARGVRPRGFAPHPPETETAGCSRLPLATRPRAF